MKTKLLPEDAPTGGTVGTELYQRMLGEDYRNPDIAALMLKVWSPTPFMLDVVTEGREQEIWHWCYHNFGRESSPIHGHEGGWHRANVTLRGKTWFGFRTVRGRPNISIETMVKFARALKMELKIKLV